ncbi:MAG TPA: haloalkane dehalogenase [Gammaproteobacteria bacterium]|jgi:haloalkane dehalogenase|nr:haloalkane dehalogenase [Gammaproteobacteria bacterium]
MLKTHQSDQLVYPSQYIEIGGSQMHYVETGQGDPILFLHGVPTSSYVWRNVMPYLAPLGRCIAVDLMGFGKSDKPMITYSIKEHIRFVEQFIQALGLKRVTLVMHGVGSIIGLDYAMRHEENCKSLVFYESFLEAFEGAEISLAFQEQRLALDAYRASLLKGVQGADFVRLMLEQSSMLALPETVISHYIEPFKEQGSTGPLLGYLNDFDDAEGSSVASQIIANYSRKLVESFLPKLMLCSVPGLITTVSTMMWAKEYLPQLEMTELGEELHLAQETNPEMFGEVVSVFVQTIEQMRE